ncbi:hypothetical protein [Desulfomicrobium salsuginis]
MNGSLRAGEEYLAELVEAIQRCTYFLDGSISRLKWPLTPEFLESRKMDVDVFETVAAINERFAKLQDTLGTAMRCAAVLSGEQAVTFLRVLTFYEKIGVLESVRQWQECRTARNLAAHDYDINYAAIADHFNTLHAMTPFLYGSAWRFADYCQNILGVFPKSKDFEPGFTQVARPFGAQSIFRR